MRYRILLVLTVLLAACSANVEPVEPTSQLDNDSDVKSETEPSPLVPTEIPTHEPEIEPTLPVVLNNLGPAPELTNEVWLNTDGPLRLAELRGKVVLLEMWTFG